MTGPIAGPGIPLAARAPETSDDARLKKTAKDLEALFVEQLYKAMRETVPQGEGAVDAGTGEDMFTGLMDQRLAADTSTQWAHGLADAAYRQLRARLPHAESPAKPVEPVEPVEPVPLTPTTAAPMALQAPAPLSLHDH